MRYAISAVAYRQNLEHKGFFALTVSASIEIRHYALVVEAGSPQEAFGIGHERLETQNPRADNWTHDCAVTEIK